MWGLLEEPEWQGPRTARTTPSILTQRASQGAAEEDGLANLGEALEHHSEPPEATRLPAIHTVEVVFLVIAVHPHSSALFAFHKSVRTNSRR